MCPDVRIIAGIEASTITSEGTCRLVIPRPESTIARRGPASSPASTAAAIAAALRELGRRRQQVAETVVGS